MRSLVHRLRRAGLVRSELALAQSLLAARHVDSLAQALREVRWIKEESEPAELSSRLGRRLIGEPLQYVLGSTSFGPCRIGCQAPILIPRPSTEHWVEALVKRWQVSNGKVIQVLDIGTGTGCIPILFQKLRPPWRCYGIDKNSQAVTLARRNALQNGCNDVTFRQLDLFHQRFVTDILDMTRGPVDLLVSNPPYLTPEVYDNLNPSVKSWEDVEALLAPSDDGLLFHRRILAMSRQLVKDQGVMALEIGSDEQAELLQGELKGGECWQDGYGDDRVVVWGIKEHECELEEHHLLLTQCHPRQLERAGLALLGLNIAEHRTGLAGKRLVTLDRPLAWHTSTLLPAHKFRAGELVSLEAQTAKSGGKQAESDKDGITGVVFRVKETEIVISLEDREMDWPQGQVMLLLLPNQATHDRLVKTLKRLKELVDKDNLSVLQSVCLGLAPPSPPRTDHDEITFKNELLDESQKRAVSFALLSREIALIHGPPGTGKTHTLVEIIRHLIEREKRILVCGPSNMSVDNIVERLSPHLKDGQMTRIGHLARVLPSILKSTLDVQSQAAGGEVLAGIRKEIDALTTRLAIPKSKKSIKGKERKESWREISALRKDFRVREAKVNQEIVQRAKVVLTTCHGAGGRQLAHLMGEEQFDVVIIDEAAQALEAQCWIPILAGRRLILAGDPLQLPPTIKSQKGTASEKHPNKSKVYPFLPEPLSLSYTLFDRLVDTHGDGIKTMLEVQYRMHENIMHFVSKELYHGRLSASSLVRDRLLSDMDNVDSNEDTQMSLIFYDTSGLDMFESTGTGDDKVLDFDSKANENEALLAVQHVKSLLTAGCPPRDIAIISPYSAQISLLRKLIPNNVISIECQAGGGSSKEVDLKDIEIGTVDAFQGREKEAIVITLVRSNESGEVGFLAEKRRLNVAMTRAKRQCVVIGDAATLRRAKGVGKDEGQFLSHWMDYLEDETRCEVRYPELAGASGF